MAWFMGRTNACVAGRSQVPASSVRRVVARGVILRWGVWLVAAGAMGGLAPLGSAEVQADTNKSVERSVDPSPRESTGAAAGSKAPVAAAHVPEAFDRVLEGTVRFKELMVPANERWGLRGPVRIEVEGRATIAGKLIGLAGQTLPNDAASRHGGGLRLVVDGRLELHGEIRGGRGADGKFVAESGGRGGSIVIIAPEVMWRNPPVHGGDGGNGGPSGDGGAGGSVAIYAKVLENRGGGIVAGSGGHGGHAMTPDLNLAGTRVLLDGGDGGAGGMAAAFPYVDDAQIPDAEASMRHSRKQPVGSNGAPGSNGSDPRSNGGDGGAGGAIYGNPGGDGGTVETPCTPGNAGTGGLQAWGGNGGDGGHGAPGGLYAPNGGNGGRGGIGGNATGGLGGNGSNATSCCNPPVQGVPGGAGGPGGRAFGGHGGDGGMAAMEATAEAARRPEQAVPPALATPTASRATEGSAARRERGSAMVVTSPLASTDAMGLFLPKPMAAPVSPGLLVGNVRAVQEGVGCEHLGRLTESSSAALRGAADACVRWRAALHGSSGPR